MDAGGITGKDFNVTDAEYKHIFCNYYSGKTSNVCFSTRHHVFLLLLMAQKRYAVRESLLFVVFFFTEIRFDFVKYEILFYFIYFSHFTIVTQRRGEPEEQLFVTPDAEKGGTGKSPRAVEGRNSSSSLHLSDTKSKEVRVARWFCAGGRRLKWERLPSTFTAAHDAHNDGDGLLSVSSPPKALQRMK